MPVERREIVDYLCREHDLSVTRACASARLSRSTYYRPVLDWRERDAEVIDELNRVVKRRPRWGFWTCFDHLRFKGFEWNHKKVHRLYIEDGSAIEREFYLCPKSILLDSFIKGMPIIIEACLSNPNDFIVFSFHNKFFQRKNVITPIP